MRTRLSTAGPAPYLAVLTVGCALALATPAAQAQFLCDPCAESSDLFGNAVARGDFNGDGYEDLAVGLPWEDIANGPRSSISNAGAVEVIYGTASGLASPNRQFWRQGASGVEDVPEAYDLFGWALTAGDFNGDGYDDLAIGVPSEVVGANDNAGAVNVLYGSPMGLSTISVPDDFWHQNVFGVEDVAEGSDYFGYALTAGDFNLDGYDDLAIGAPTEGMGGIGSAGAVNVLYGSSTGLSATAIPDQLWHQDVANVEDVAEPGDSFGEVLTAGDFNGDGFDDLAIGMPYEAVGAIVKAGAVNVIYGSSAGLSATAVPDQFWHQDVANVEDVAEAPGDKFGAALTAGDFNRDGFDDLAIGAPYEGIGSIVKGGAVNLIYGSSVGLSATAVPDQFWHQDVANVEDLAEGAGDAFGWALTAGDFNGDGFDDLAIGVPYEAIGSIVFAGAMNVLYGSSIGLSATVIPDQFWHQNSSNVQDVAEPSDTFGYALAAGDFNGDGFDDLASGVPYEDLYTGSGSLTEAGAVHVVHGSSVGLSATIVSDQTWTQSYVLPPQP